MDRFVTPTMPSKSQRARSERRAQDGKMAAAAVPAAPPPEHEAGREDISDAQSAAPIPGTAGESSDPHGLQLSKSLQAQPPLPLDKPATYGDIVRAVQDAVTPLLEKHTTQLQSVVEGFKEHLHQLAGQITNTETRLGETFQDVHVLKGQYDSLHKEHLQLRNKVDDLENRSRRSNLRVLGIPEAVKGPELFRFLQETLLDLLHVRDSCTGMVIERAHRLGPARTSSESRPRVVIFKSLNYIHKEVIWQASRKQRDLCWEGSRIFIFQDYSAEVTRARKEFAPLCSALIKDNKKFALLYPARLRLFDGDSFKEFHTVADAEGFIRESRENRPDRPAVA